MSLDNAIRQTLRQIVETYPILDGGSESIRLCRSLLWDLAGDQPLAINLLIQALELDAPRGLRTGSSPELAQGRLVMTMQQTYGTSPENARWAVESWAFALGLAVPKLKKSTPIPVEPRSKVTVTSSLVEPASLPTKPASTAPKSTPSPPKPTLLPTAPVPVGAKAAPAPAKPVSTTIPRSSTLSSKVGAVLLLGTLLIAGFVWGVSGLFDGIGVPAPTAGVPAEAIHINSVDGTVYIYVNGGTFSMGSEDGSDNEKPVHRVTVDEFWITQMPVTNAQYSLCVVDGACTAPGNSRWDDSTYADHPVTDVNWEQANIYARWAGGRLPTEAEWERACRGDDSRIYPWGDEIPTDNLLNFGLRAGGTTPVGSYPSGASPYGLLDMAGNVLEWTADWYDADYYANSPAQNPTGPSTGNARVVRGGAWTSSALSVRCTARSWHNLSYRAGRTGFRVVSADR